MIDYVAPKEKIKADTINALIDGQRGPARPASDIGFTQYDNGSILFNEYSYDVEPERWAPPFLTARWGYDTKLSAQSLDLMLGRDLDQAKSMLRHRGQLISEIGFYDAESDTFKKVTSSDWETNGQDNAYSGFVPTGISSLEGSSAKGTLYAYLCEGVVSPGGGPEGGNRKHYCVFANTDDYTSFVSKAKQEFGESYGLSCEDVAVAIASQTKKDALTPGTSEEYGPVLLQDHVGYLDIGQDIDYCQFQLTGFLETSSVGQGDDKVTKYRARLAWWNWYDEYPTKAGNWPDSPVKWNSEAIFPFEQYTHGWNTLSVTDWYEGGLPSQHQSYYLRIRVTANPYIPKHSTGGNGEQYIYNFQNNTGWNITSAFIQPGGEDEENETHIAQQEGHMGYNTVRAQYQLGTIYLGGQSIYVHQVQHGAMNFMQFDWTHPPLSESGPGIEGWFKPDSEISDSQTSSIERDTYTYVTSVELSDGTWEKKEEEGYYFRLFNFKYGGDSEEQPLLSCVLSDDWVTNEDCKILVRQEGAHGIGQRGNAVLKYARLSVAIPDLSVDSLVENTKHYSVQLSSQYKGQGIVQLYGFQQEGSNTNIHLNDLSNKTDDKIQLLVRTQDDDGSLKLKYASLQVDLSGSGDQAQNGLTDLSAQLSADSEVPEANLSSLSRGTTAVTVKHKNLSGELEDVTIEAKYYKMYQFEGDEKLVKTDEEQDKYTVLVKKDEDGKKVLHYMALSSFADEISCDSEYKDMGQCSIEKAGEDGKTLQLYNFDSQAPDLTVVVSREENDTEKDSHVLVRDFESSAGGELRYATLSIDFGRSISVDTEFDNDTKSIDAYGVDKDKIRLHNFDSSGSDVELKYDHENPTGTEDGYQFLVRNNRELKYATLSLGIPEDLSSKVDGLSNDLSSVSANQVPDSEVSELQLNSIERRIYTQDGKTYKAYSLYDFHNGAAKVSKDDVDEDTTQVLVRTNESGAKVLKYLDLSAFAGQVSVDTDVESTGQYSLEHIKEADGLDYYQLYQFEDTYRNLTLSIDNEHIELPDDYRVLVRRVDGEGNLVLDYANLSINLSADVSCDSEGTTNKKSIGKNSNNELELYNFHNGSASELTVKFDNGVMTNSGSQVLVRNNGVLKYAALSCTPRLDTSYHTYSNSLEWNSSYNCAMINGFNRKANRTVAEVSASAQNYDVLMRRHSGSYYYTEYLNIGPLLSASSPDGKTTDLTVITQVVWDSSNYKIQPKGKKLTFVNGLLSAVSDTEFNVGGIATTPWTGE